MRCVVLILSVWLMTCWSSLVCGADARPNFILCMADDQGWGDVGYYGHPHLQTPVLDEMAASGLRFDRFYAAAPVCSPTRGSVMTGRHPNRFGCFSWGHSLRPQEVTIAEALREAGYMTGHFGKWHLGSVREDSPVNPGRSGFDEWVSSPNFYENSPLLSNRGRVDQTDGESSMITVEAAIPFMKRAQAAGRPFLAVVWFGNPHTPHQALKELRDLYPDLSEKEQNYYGEITGIDQAMGRLRTELQATGLRENTVLWYTSDNGAQGRSPGSTGGLRGAKGQLYEGGIRVPATIEWPRRITTPRITNVPAVTSDIYPTLLELAGVTNDHDHPLDGTSLVSVIDGSETAREQPIAFWVYPEGGIRTPSAEWMKQLQDEQQGRSPATAAPQLTSTALLQQRYDGENLVGHTALILKNHKLHRIPNGKQSLEFRLELYDLMNDPQEERDLSETHPERAKELSDTLRNWQRSVINSLNGDDYR